MARRNDGWRISLLGGLLVAGFAAFQGTSAEVKAEDDACASLSAALRADPTASQAFDVVKTTPLYRMQERPYARMAHGVKIQLLASEGVSEADLHRAAMCSARAGTQSVLGVEGAQIKVARRGGHYELSVTSPDPVRARDIQRRAESLR